MPKLLDVRRLLVRSSLKSVWASVFSVKLCGPPSYEFKRENKKSSSSSTIVVVVEVESIRWRKCWGPKVHAYGLYLPSYLGESSIFRSKSKGESQVISPNKSKAQKSILNSNKNSTKYIIFTRKYYYFLYGVTLCYIILKEMLIVLQKLN